MGGQRTPTSEPVQESLSNPMFQMAGLLRDVDPWALGSTGLSSNTVDVPMRLAGRIAPLLLS